MVFRLTGDDTQIYLTKDIVALDPVAPPVREPAVIEAQRVAATAYGYELVHLRTHGMRGSQRLVYGPAADGAHIVGGEHAPAQYVPPMPVGPARVTPGIHRRTPCGTLCIPCRAIVRIVRRRTWRTRQAPLTTGRARSSRRAAGPRCR